MNTITGKERNIWIDIAKGIGIILVVYGHVLRGLDNAQLPINKEFFITSDLFIYSFHMPLFFVLSGLLFKKGLNKYKSKGLLNNKIKTILYPFIIWSILQTAIEVMLSNFTNGQIGMENLLTAIFIPRAQYWFLHALFCINLINILLQYVFRKHWLLISSMLSILFHIFPINISIFSNSVTYLIFFNVGIFICEYIESTKTIEKSNKLIFIFISCICMFIILEYVYIVEKITLLKDMLILPLLGTITVFCYSLLISKYKVQKKVLSLLGKYSLHIYILHILVASGTRIVLLRGFNIDNVTIHIFLGTFLGITLPLIISVLLKNNLIYRRLFSLK